VNEQRFQQKRVSRRSLIRGVAGAAWEPAFCVQNLPMATRGMTIAGAAEAPFLSQFRAAWCHCSCLKDLSGNPTNRDLRSHGHSATELCRYRNAHNTKSLHR
jgi:hypothetical protein